MIDQRLLPGTVTWLDCAGADEVAQGIRDMVIRGAPAIGCAAAYGMVLAAYRGQSLTDAAAILRAARPTAVNLSWALDRMLEAARAGATTAAQLEAEAERIRLEDERSCEAIGRLGAELIPNGATVLTHCNAGALATAAYGTALGVIRAAAASGKRIRVLADETRPYLQGGRLTAWECVQEGIPVEVITDNMAGYFMKKGEITCVVVGADRIAANGDVANKIGTYSVAVLARAHGIPLYVAAPLSTLDPRTATGAGIPIEERSAEEVTHLGGQRLVPEGAAARHPAFDVTPAELVSAIITETAVARAPYDVSLAACLRAGGERRS
jgi:methylthioribose-1-phosphate isomerase